jgi:hypothetical protein
MDSSSSGTVQPARRTLVPGKLNVVGETHNESDARRVAEMQFSLAKTGSANYWTEAEFLDAYQRFGDRRPRGGQDQAQDDPAAADLQYRAAHCAALVIVTFEELANEADRVAAALPTSATPTAALRTFADGKIRAFIQARDLLAAGWEKTQSEVVNAAAEAVYTNVKAALATYFAAIRNAPPGQQVAATKALAGNRVALGALAAPLAQAVSATPPTADAATLAQYKRWQIGTKTGTGVPEQAKGSAAADLMVFRAAFAAAYLMARFDELADAADRVAAAQPQSADAAFRKFVDENFRNFVDIRNRLTNTWEAPKSGPVDPAIAAVFTNVQAVFTNAQAAIKTFVTTPPQGTIDVKLAATKALARSRVAFGALLGPLAKAAGVTSPNDSSAAVMAQYLREQRSRFMGLAAGWSKEIGVWKIGDLHVDDLKEGGPAKVDASRINLISEEDFYAEFTAWQQLQKST